MQIRNIACILISDYYLNIFSLIVNVLKYLKNECTRYDYDTDDFTVFPLNGNFFPRGSNLMLREKYDVSCNKICSGKIELMSS